MIRVNNEKDGQTSLIFNEASLPAIVIPAPGMSAYQIDKTGRTTMLSPEDSARLLSSVPSTAFESVDMHKGCICGKRIWVPHNKLRGTGGYFKYIRRCLRDQDGRPSCEQSRKVAESQTMPQPLHDTSGSPKG